MSKKEKILWLLIAYLFGMIIMQYWYMYKNSQDRLEESEVCVGIAQEYNLLLEDYDNGE